MVPGDSLEMGAPDLSHLSEEERQIILQVLQRQKAEERKEEEIAQKGNQELWDIERQIQERKENAQKLIGTQDDAICQICLLTKFADGIGHKCFYCQLRSCARCGGKTTSKNKNIWACSLCQKRQQILARTGKWFQQQQQQGVNQENSFSLQEQIHQTSLPQKSSDFAISEHTRKAQQLQRKQSLSRQQKRNSLTRQNTLKRQQSIESSVENKQQQQNCVINGSETTSATYGAETSKWNGQTQKSLRQQQQNNRDNRETVRQKSINVRHSIDEIVEENSDKNAESSRTTLQKQNSNKVSNIFSGQQSQQQQQQKQNLQQQQSLSYQTTTPSPTILQQQQRPSTSTQINNRINETSTISISQQPSLDINYIPAVSESKKSSKHSPRKITEGSKNVTTTSTLPNQNNASPSFIGVNSSSNRQPCITTTNNDNNINPQLPILKTRRTKMTSNRQQQQQLLHSSCPSSSDEQINNSSSLKIKQQINNKLQINKLSSQQQTSSHGLTLSTSLQLETISNKKEEGLDFSEKEMLRYIYDEAHPNARRNTVSTKGPTISLFGQRNVATLNNNKSFLSANSMLSSNSASNNIPLANRIRNYLSNPSVSWQPSTDQRRLIGHLLLNKQQQFSCSNNDLLFPSSSSTLNLTNNIDFGLKVVGCRDPVTGRLGAFVTRVRPGSIADVVGHLRSGDEVLEWNGHPLQNASPEIVYSIVQNSKTDVQLELIVSRPLIGDGDDFLNLRRRKEQQYFNNNKNNNNSFLLPHSQSLISANNLTTPGANIHQQQNYFSSRVTSPLVLQQQQYVANDNVLINNYFDPNSLLSFSPVPLLSDNINDTGIICGRLEMALLYLSQKRELIISLSRAYDLIPRPDGSERNSYVKLFLLPDRSEKSRRQSKVITSTLSPVWEEHFFYENLDEIELSNRVLEVTLWDYDAFESHSFLGEALIDLSQTQLNNQPNVYSLLDMDDDNPIRVKLRYSQRRYSSSITPPTTQQRSRSQMNFPYRSAALNSSSFGGHDERQNDERRQHFRGNSEVRGNYKSINSLSVHDLPLHSSRSRRTYDLDLENFENYCYGRRERFYYNDDDEELFWDEKGRGRLKNKNCSKNICLSDQEQEWEIGRRRKDRNGREHGRRNRGEHKHHQHHHSERHHNNSNNTRDNRRPQSATALRNIAEWELRHHSSGGHNDIQDNLNHQENSFDSSKNNRKTTRQQELREQEIIGGGNGDYGSDGSIETLSVNSATSMQNRALLRQQQQKILKIQQLQQHQQQSQSSNEDNIILLNSKNNNNGCDDDYCNDDDIIREERKGGGGFNEQNQLNNMSSTTSIMMSAKEMKDRKKSLMTRLIPGRNGTNESNKRLGFARSEEVGISTIISTTGSTTTTQALIPPEHNRDFIKQNSKESTDSSDNWLPILPDKPLGSFMENLGPGQVVGRQALGSLSMGELLIGLSIEQGTGLVLDIREAKNLKIGPKGAPASYVKAYLMEGRNCIAKAKTQLSRTRSASPSFRQKLIFTENLRNKMLQLTIIGDFGRLERKIFMGVCQIALEELHLGKDQLIDWYKLFNSDSLNSNIIQQQQLSGGVLRKESGGELSSIN